MRQSVSLFTIIRTLHGLTAVLLGMPVCLLVIPRTAPAQVLYGSLTGHVTDPSEAAVPGAKVEALNSGTGISRQATADDRGLYLFSDLQSGLYTITVSAPSFGSVSQSGVRIDANTVQRVDVVLQLSQVNQSITINASAATLQTDRADVQSQITTSQLADLPSGTNRNFQNILKIVPGATPPGASNSAAVNPQGSLTFYVNGATNTSNNTKIDGASNIYPWLPQIAAYVPPVESIEAVNVVTNSFDAEQGMASGSAVNVSIKSGTNQLHGGAWEYNTESALKARNFFYLGNRNPKNILNQFGLDVGGPIRKNKLFFFADWERTVQRQLASGFQTIATSALRQGNFADVSTTIYNPFTGTANGTARDPFPGNQIPVSLLNAAALKMAGLLPQPNQPGVSNDYFAVANTQFLRDNVDMKINYNPSQDVTVFGRYSISPNQIFDPQPLGAAGGNTLDGGQPGNAGGRVQSSSIGSTYTIDPHLLLDGNVAFTRLHVTATNTDINQNYGSDVLGIPGTNGPSRLQGGYPSFAFTGFSSLGNPNNSNPLEFRDNLYVAAANLSWVKGSHSLRFGVEAFHFSITDFQSNISVGVRGGFTFTGGLTALSGGPAPNLYNSWADFLLGLPQTMAKDYQYINPAVLNEETYSAYVRDQWQVSRKLTVSIGLRYERYPYGYSKYGIGGIRYDTNTNLVYLGGTKGVPFNAGVDTGWGNIVPRLGIAYRLNERTVVRAGFGINTNAEFFTRSVQVYPEVISTQFSGANSFAAAGSLSTGIPAFAGLDLSNGTLALPSNVGTNSYTTPYRRGYTESYNLMVQHTLGEKWDIGAGFVGTHAIRVMTYVNVNAAGPGAGKAGQPLYQQWGNASTVTMYEPFGTTRFNSLQSRVTRRFGNSMIGASYTFSKALNFADNDQSNLTWAWAPAYGRNYSLAGFDRTHNFNVYSTYDLPFGRGKSLLSHGVAAAIASGWQINGILSRFSGTPFTVTSSGTSLNAPGNTQTAQQVLSNVSILGGAGPGQPYFEPGAFAPVTTPTFGNSGRNILRGPAVFNVDASIYRTFGVRERLKVQFRAEAMGLTNTPQFANPNSVVSNATFVNGQITNLNGYGIISSATGERQIRFALKLLF
jgi:hypothetical protein